MTADENYPVLHRKNLTIAIEMPFSQKQKNVSQFLLHFQSLHYISTILKKKMTFISFVFPKLRTPKRWLDKFLKSPVLEDSSTSKTGNVHNNCSNLHHITFIIFIDHCQVNSVGKSLSYWHAKCWDSFLTHWLTMTSILFFIGTI